MRVCVCVCACVCAFASMLTRGLRWTVHSPSICLSSYLDMLASLSL